MPILSKPGSWKMPKSQAQRNNQESKQAHQNEEVYPRSGGINGKSIDQLAQINKLPLVKID